MELKGEQVVRSGRADVWRALNSPEILARCMVGCRSFVPSGENRFDAVLAIKVGPILATFTSVVNLTDVVPEDRFTIVGEGKAGPAGFARAAVRVALSNPDGNPGSTHLSYEADAQIGGKLAQIGGRLIQGAAQAYIDGFFDRLRGELEHAAIGPAKVSTRVADIKRRRRMWAWVAAAAALLAVFTAYRMFT